MNSTLPFSQLILRIASAIILLAHSVPVMLDLSVNKFGTEFLDNAGFAPFGLYLAWIIKIIHVAGAVSLLVNRYITLTCLLNIAIFIAGIVMIHYAEGWFVVGNGRNGMEFNFLLICVLGSIAVYNRQERSPLVNAFFKKGKG